MILSIGRRSISAIEAVGRVRPVQPGAAQSVDSRFIKGLKLFYLFKDVWFGLLKSASFGFTIRLIGCIVGLGTRGGAEGVGRSMRSAYTVGDRIAMLYDGRIRQVGRVAEIQHTEDAVVRQFIEGRAE